VQVVLEVAHTQMEQQVQALLGRDTTVALLVLLYPLGVVVEVLVQLGLGLVQPKLEMAGLGRYYPFLALELYMLAAAEVASHYLYQPFLVLAVRVVGMALRGRTIQTPL
jgi:hypothetical protein